MMVDQSSPRRPQRRSWFLPRATFVMAALALLSPLPALAHQLTVFATVADDMVKITATFANGNPVMSGVLEIRGADDAVLLSQDVDGQWPVLFPVGDHKDGLRIAVDAGNGHSNYWILTPNDLADDQTD